VLTERDLRQYSLKTPVHHWLRSLIKITIYECSRIKFSTEIYFEPHGIFWAFPVSKNGRMTAICSQDMEGWRCQRQYTAVAANEQAGQQSLKQKI